MSENLQHQKGKEQEKKNAGRGKTQRGKERETKNEKKTRKIKMRKG